MYRYNLLPHNNNNKNIWLLDWSIQYIYLTVTPNCYFTFKKVKYFKDYVLKIL